MSDIKKFQFTTGGLFVLSATNYSGFFNVKDNKAYTTKYEQKTPLSNAGTALTKLTLSDKFLNRLPTENISLTYALSDLMFESNEFINNNSINLKLEKSYSNFLDVFRACFMASSKLPYSNVYTAQMSGVSTGLNLRWENDYRSTSYIRSPSAVLTVNSKILAYENYYSQNKTLVVSNSSTIFAYKINPQTLTFAMTFSSNKITTVNDTAYGQLNFANIGSIGKGKNNLYIGDIERNVIYAYDTTSVLMEDRALGKSFNLFNTVDSSQGNFTTPSIIEASDNIIFVYDDGQKIIHYYDYNFNKINTYKNTKFFSDHPPVSLTYYKLYDQLYVLTSDYKIVVIDANTNASFVDIQTTGFGTYEKAKKIVFSNSYSDVFYLLTNQGLYKKFVSNPFLSIGNFSFTSKITGSNTQLYGDMLYDITTLDTLSGVDDLTVYGFNQILNYREETVFNSLLK